jgi:mono/diheme cytochrome c family protein
MRKVKKIAKWTGIILLVLVVSVSVLTAARQDLRYEAPYPKITSSTDTAVIARGKHLVWSVAHCADCHSPLNTDSMLALGQEPPLMGGRVFDFGLGKFYSRNLTGDSATGLGKVSDAEIARTLYYGVFPDGKAVLDFMPFHNISESDMSSIISYLRTLKPVKNKVPEDEYNMMGKLVKAFLIKPVGPSEEIVKYVQPDTTATYGKYLVMNVANCSGCHTQRGMAGEVTGELLAGGGPMEEKGFPALTPPNLTPDSSSRIFGWGQQNFIKRFRMGKLIKHSHMPWNSYKKMTDRELIAIYNFLQSVKPAKTAVVKK